MALLACGRICSSCHAEQYLFLVGVKDYSQKGELTDLKYAEEDVQTLAQLFSEAGVPTTNIVLMTQRVAANKARFAPSAEQIRYELDLFLKILKPEESIIFGSVTYTYSKLPMKREMLIFWVVCSVNKIKS